MDVSWSNGQRETAHPGEERADGHFNSSHSLQGDVGARRLALPCVRQRGGEQGDSKDGNDNSLHVGLSVHLQCVGLGFGHLQPRRRILADEVRSVVGVFGPHWLRLLARVVQQCLKA